MNARTGTTTRRLTGEDLARTADDDLLRHELLGGEEYVTPAPGTGHQASSGDLFAALHRHVQERGLGRVFAAPTDVVLSPEDIVQPDILFVAADRLEIITEANIQGPPDLVVEILSPATAHVDRGRKLDLYERSGVREVWILDRAGRFLEVHAFTPTIQHRVFDERHEVVSRVFPDLVLRVADLL